MSDFNLTLLPKLDLTLLSKLDKLESKLLSDSIDTLSTNSVNGGWRLTTKLYIKASALVRLSVEEGNNQARLDKKVRTSVACAARRKSDLTAD